MASQKRATSIDMASLGFQFSPAPPQYTHSTPKTKDCVSNNPYHHSTAIPIQSTGKSAQEDTKDSPTKLDFHDSNHPHYVQPVAKSYDYDAPSPRPRHYWRRKRVLIPSILALLFFLTTLWFTSIALGVRMFMILRPLPSDPVVHDINVFIDGQAYLTSAAATPKPTMPISATSTVLTPSATSTASNTTPLPNTTGRLHLVQTGQPSLEDIDRKPGRRQVARFITVTRRT